MSDVHVYDKAKWHYEGDFPSDLTDSQGFVHTGMFLGWLVDRGLVSEEFEEGTTEGIAAFKQRTLTGPQLYESWDGVLADDMLSDEGNEFARHYFDFHTGQFVDDYDELLSNDLPSMYHVEDTWENYDTLRARIDQRHREWKESNVVSGE
jgi:hypothetical protein